MTTDRETRAVQGVTTTYVIETDKDEDGLYELWVYTSADTAEAQNVLTPIYQEDMIPNADTALTIGMEIINQRENPESAGTPLTGELWVRDSAG